MPFRLNFFHIKSYKNQKDLNEQGKTIVIATHDYPLIRRFPARIITVDEQKIFETVITWENNTNYHVYYLDIQQLLENNSKVIRI